MITTANWSLGVRILAYIIRAGGPSGPKCMEQSGFEPPTPTLRTWCSPS